MDIMSLIGIIIGFLALVLGMIAKGANPASLANPAALIIILAGTVACLTIAFPKNEIKNFGKLLKIIFTEKKSMTEKELLPLFVGWARIVRREGIIGLQKDVEEIDNQFLKKGFELVLEGQDSKDIQEMLEDDIAAMEQRHATGAGIFTQAGTYAPTLGVMGAVMGLVGALGYLDDIEHLGKSIAAAFMATLLGIFTGYVLWHPMANKLKRKSIEEIRINEFIIKGIISIQEDPSPLLVEKKLLPYLPSGDRNWKEEENTNKEGEEAGENE